MRKNVMMIAMAIAAVWGLSTTTAWGQTTGHDVTMKAGTTDAANWKAKAGNGTAKALPLEGVAEGATVTVKYDGRRKVKRVTAVKQAAGPALGDLYYSDGTWSATLVAGKTPIGVIAYLGTDAFTETGTFVGDNKFTGHGLVLCLKNAASDVCWSTETGAYEFGEGARVNSSDALKRTTDVSGYTNTATLAAKADAATKYPAVWQARNYTALPAPATGTTGWFLPSAQQWVKMLEGLGGLADGAPNFATSWFEINLIDNHKIEAALAKAGDGNYDSMIPHLWYWSSSEYSSYFAVNLKVDATNTGYGFGFYWSHVSKDFSGDSDDPIRVRPVLAF